MAGKDKKQEDKSKGGGGEGKKRKKLHLHQIITTKAKDGSFGHEHVYKDHPDDVHSHPPVFAGTSKDMEDLHAHMDDHFGGGGGGGAEEAAEGEAQAAGGAAPEAAQEPGPEAA
jgi:hypothetical protein